MRNRISGVDPSFPYLGEYERYPFPKPDVYLCGNNSIIAVGGNLSPGMLLSAYEQGIFPWYNPEDPILWQSPDSRMVLFPEKLHIAASMKKVFKKRSFEFALDRNFKGVIRGCAEMFRPGQGGTWITEDMIAAYTELHRLGWAHSAESYQHGELVGGCYGIRLGKVFFGESMFAKQSNASKAAFLSLAQRLFADGVAFIDCQVHTNYLASLGAEIISRKAFLQLLEETLAPRRQIPYTGEAQTFYTQSDGMDRRGSWAFTTLAAPI
ncbi:MAG: leucyl/phenylalanyl-tRNA--protein transferase [Treponema sp.]|jgi:leucyl/phenylalanyl-tRNA--protein transferase|nr:leucyl/phenylalanyl-tRNA--protein transferase [Treponema sp.]